MSYKMEIFLLMTNKKVVNFKTVKSDPKIINLQIKYANKNVVF